MLRRKWLTTMSMENWAKLRRLAPLGAVCLLCALPAAASTMDLNLSTTTGNTTGYTIASDTNCVSGTPSSCSGGPTEGTNVNAVTDVTALGWAPNGTISDGQTPNNSIWIAPLADQGSPSGDGSTIYDVTFSLPTGATGITLYINFAADDYATIILNPTGSDTTVFAPSTGAGSQEANGMWTTPHISGLHTESSGFNIGGTNTLEFIVPNNTSDHTGNCCGPTGIQVDADLVYSTASTPEPGTLALIGTGLLGLGVSFRRRKR
jgi:hypothetical protein